LFPPVRAVIEIPVELGARSYRISIGQGILERTAGFLPSIDYTSAAILTHPHLSDPYAEPVRRSLEDRGIPVTIITSPAGIRGKTLQTAARLYGRLLAVGIDRKGLIVTVGGGVLGDVGGFVAATFLRGIDFVQIPTTLLAQVDASIGGKTGVDLAGGKNLVGAFHQPRAVVIDLETLRTLPLRELRSGLAEVVKYGIIADEALFEFLAAQMPLIIRRDFDVLSSAIERSCRTKAAVVAKDETEQGRRAILNFGHTVGHALETVTGYRRYKHGEAISIGMISASLIGESIGITPPDVTTRLAGVLRAARLPTVFPAEVPHNEVLEAMSHDKKALSGRPRFVLARAIGNVEHGIDVPETAVRAALARQGLGFRV